MPDDILMPGTFHRLAEFRHIYQETGINMTVCFNMLIERGTLKELHVMQASLTYRAIDWAAYITQLTDGFSELISSATNEERGCIEASIAMWLGEWRLIDELRQAAESPAMPFDQDD